MSIRALRTLISVHRNGSFRAAAEVEHLTPAAVSQQMRNLEQSWNLELFDRSSKSPKLTLTGLALVGEAETVISSYDSLPEKVSSGEEISGELILGALPTTLTGLVPLALSQLKIAHPAVRVRIIPGLSNQLLSQVERGQLNAAVISKPEAIGRSLNFTKIAVEEMVLLAATGTEDLDPSELLRTQPFIRFNRDAVVGRQIESWLQEKNIVVNDAMELEGLEAISSMVAANLGISIVPQRCVLESEHLPLKQISLGADSPRRVLGLASRNDSPRTSVIRAAESVLLEAVKIGKFSLD